MAVLAAGLTVLPVSADAQVHGTAYQGESGPWFTDIGAGAAFPVGDFADLEDPGATIGMGIGYHLDSAFSLRAQGRVDFLNGANRADAYGGSYSDLDLW